MSSHYVDNSRKIDNFVRAVEAATDIKGENLAIERELAQSSSVGSLPSSSENAQVQCIEFSLILRLCLQDSFENPEKGKFPLTLVFILWIILIFVVAIVSFVVVQYIG